MNRPNRLAGLFLLLSGKAPEELAAATGIAPGRLAELDRELAEPRLWEVERLAEAAGLTVADGEKVLAFADLLRKGREPGAS
jgi:hypothetical protein